MFIQRFSLCLINEREENQSDRNIHQYSGAEHELLREHRCRGMDVARPYDGNRSRFLAGDPADLIGGRRQSDLSPGG